MLGLLLGRHAPVAAELESLTRQHPLRERLWALRAVALAGSGRQAEATTVLGEVRALLDVELGLEPGAELRAVQTAVLRQAVLPTLARTPAPARAVDDVSPGMSPGGPPGGSPSWPLVGRESEAAVLNDLVDRVAAGPTGAGLAALTGEPGIGEFPAVRRGDRPGRGGRCAGGDRPVLAGRGRPAVVAVGPGPGRPRRRCPPRRVPQTGPPTSAPGRPSSGSWWTPPRSVGCGGARGPALGRRLDAAGAPDAGGDRRRCRRAGRSAAGRRHLARAPPAVRGARRRGRGVRPRPRRPAAARRGGRRGRRPAGGGGDAGRAGGRRRRRALPSAPAATRSSSSSTPGWPGTTATWVACSPSGAHRPRSTTW